MNDLNDQDRVDGLDLNQLSQKHKLNEAITGDSAHSQAHQIGLKKEEQNLQFRGLLIWWVIIIGSLYLAAVIILLYIHVNKFEEPLSDVTMGFLLTTTTTNVLGMCYLVIRNLFPVKKTN